MRKYFTKLSTDFGNYSPEERHIDRFDFSDF